MTMPRLSSDEYSDVVERRQRLLRRGAGPSCMGHEYARVPWDTEKQPEFVCVHCLNMYAPDMRKFMKRPDPRKVVMPERGKGPL